MSERKTFEAQKRSFNIDINVCSSCNLGCRYCSEGKNLEPFTQSRVSETKTKIRKEDLFNLIANIDDEIKPLDYMISFWGGEPFLNFEYCKDVILHYKDNPKMKFFFYTNGMYIKKFIKEINELNAAIGFQRLIIQISYDGGKVNDIERVTKNGKSTSKYVKEAFNLLKDNGVNVIIKSTISPGTFKYMFDAFKDVVEMQNYQGNYFPTPDAFSEYKSEKWAEYYQDLKRNISLIARYIYQRNLPLNLFKWFEHDKALCAAGINYITLDLNGNVTPCHSCMYDIESEHKIGTIYDIDIIKKIKDASERYHHLVQIKQQDPICSKCTSVFCVRCPAGSYNLSYVKKNTEHLKGQARADARWLSRNVDMCQVFKINDIIYNSLLKAMQVKNTQN